MNLYFSGNNCYHLLVLLLVTAYQSSFWKCLSMTNGKSKEGWHCKYSSREGLDTRALTNFHAPILPVGATSDHLRFTPYCAVCALALIWDILIWESKIIIYFSLLFAMNFSFAVALAAAKSWCAIESVKSGKKPGFFSPCDCAPGQGLNITNLPSYVFVSFQTSL